jgi:transcriptional regulator with XRE-family HTH domain
MVLGGQLRRLREASSITREEAGRAIGGSESKISRLELGRVNAKERDVADLLALYGVTDDAEQEIVLDLARQAKQPGWWNRYNDLMPRWFLDYVGLEESASRIQTYEVQFVPGLLQTEGYARALIAQGRPEDPEDEVVRRVAMRMRRKKLLTEPDAPRLWAVIDEAVLRRPVGSVALLADQVQYLLDVTRLPNVTLQIAPFRLGSYAAEGAFTLLRFAEPELPDIVYLERLGGALYLDRPAEVETYLKVSIRLAAQAATPDESQAMLVDTLRDLR